MKFLFNIERLKCFLQDYYYIRNLPQNINRNFINLNSSKLELINSSLGFSTKNKDNIHLIESLIVTLNKRFIDHRMKIIPWLDSVKTLKNAKVLEIGCGHGTSTVALAEQGANVTAIDINESYLNAAKYRCKVYGLDVEFKKLNAINISESFLFEKFDVIIFWAVLEHMTIQERITALRESYILLPEGGFLCIVGSPNRLHYFDSHTSGLPFFNWLPDELAMLYASESKREDYVDFIKDNSNQSDKLIDFYRWGRGLSYHEIETAIKPLAELHLVSDLQSFHMKRGFISNLVYKTNQNYKFGKVLHNKYPTIPACFFHPYLNIIIKK